MQVNSFTNRSSHLRMSSKVGVLKNIVKFTGKHLCCSLFLKVPANLLKRKSSTGVFLFCEFGEILKRSSFFTEHLQWLLLYTNDKFAPITNQGL